MTHLSTHLFALRTSLVSHTCHKFYPLIYSTEIMNGTLVALLLLWQNETLYCAYCWSPLFFEETRIMYTSQHQKQFDQLQCYCSDWHGQFYQFVNSCIIRMCNNLMGVLSVVIVFGFFYIFIRSTNLQSCT